MRAARGSSASTRGYVTVRVRSVPVPRTPDSGAAHATARTENAPLTSNEGQVLVTGYLYGWKSRPPAPAPRCAGHQVLRPPDIRTPGPPNTQQPFTKNARGAVPPA